MNLFILSLALANVVVGALLTVRFGVRTLALVSVGLAIISAEVWFTGTLSPLEALGTFLLLSVGLQTGYGAALVSRALFAPRSEVSRGESRSIGRTS